MTPNDEFRPRLMEVNRPRRELEQKRKEEDDEKTKALWDSMTDAERAQEFKSFLDDFYNDELDDIDKFQSPWAKQLWQMLIEYLD